MLDIGWTELLVVAVILIVVVGPKDLPPMIRAFGKMTKRLRQTAGEFRAQFDEALREAELDDLKNSVNDIRSLNPANTIRETLNPLRQMGQEIKSDLERSTRLDTKSAPLDDGYEDNSILPDVPLGLGEPPQELRPVTPPSAVANTANSSTPAPVAATAPATSAPASAPVVAKKTAVRKSAAGKTASASETAVPAKSAGKTAKPAAPAAKAPAKLSAAKAEVAKPVAAEKTAAKPAPRARKTKSEDRA
uniref:Sec-independent protein translocase protein TatB n=1 Tax=Agrobacterium albertimagni TaxID=147266 RepID=A0A7C1T059_9HYPH